MGQLHRQKVITVLAGGSQQAGSPLPTALLPWGLPSGWTPSQVTYVKSTQANNKLQHAVHSRANCSLQTGSGHNL